MKLVLLIALGSTVGSNAETPGEIRAKTALSLAAAAREREYIQSVKALPNEGKCFESVAEAEKASKASGKQLILWVGMKCESVPSVRQALSNAIHCHVDSFNGDSSPRIVFQTIDGSSMRLERKSLVECPECSVATVRKLSGIK